MLLFESRKYAVVHVVPNEVGTNDLTTKWRRTGKVIDGQVQSFKSSDSEGTFGPYTTNKHAFYSSVDPDLRNNDIIREEGTGRMFKVQGNPENVSYGPNTPGPDLDHFVTGVDELDYRIPDDQL